MSSLRTLLSLGLVVAASLAAPRPARAVLDVELIVGPLEFILYATWAPNDASRIFLVDRLGRVMIFKNGAVLPTPFLDISSETLPDYGEQGLLGMCFHPDFATNGYFYVYFIKGVPAAGGNGVSTVRRYTVSANPDSADPASAHLIFDAAQPQTNHNGGTILFGPDGYLYLALGDGGTGGFRSQDLSDPMGKFLRFDVNGDDYPGDPTKNYAIPPANPFVGDPEALPEVWSYGWRNPYRFSFDRLTGDLWVGDVGQHAREEIDFQPAASAGGENYGWHLMEGFECNTPPTDCNDGSLTLPVYDYPHLTEGCYSVTGGTVYRGTALGAAFQGKYFFADFCDGDLPGFSGRIYSFEYVNAQVEEFTEWTVDLDPPGTERIIFPGAIVEDPAGELYVVEYRATLSQLWKIVPEPGFVGAPEKIAASGLSLSKAVPNPSAARVAWEYSLAGPGSLRASILDAAGRVVRALPDRTAPSGAIEWDGRDSAGRLAGSGVYFLRAESAGVVRTERVIRTR
jgi:glucose/arabinose dehydrogenase